MLRFLIIPLTILFMAPMISADSNNLFFESTYDSGIQNQGFMSIELNQDGTLAYASFGKTLIQYSPTNQDTIQSKLFEQEILSIALSRWFEISSNHQGQRYSIRYVLRN